MEVQATRLLVLTLRLVRRAVGQSQPGVGGAGLSAAVDRGAALGADLGAGNIQLEFGQRLRDLVEETQAVFVYWAICPFCATEQLMDFNLYTRN